MSRCFPFPPPGYEKKPRIEDTIALKEEKKEKKHKKEKKDREKREGKEKKDKDKERRDKKEKHKKEKHRDKKKKDKDKDKDKGSNSETSGAYAATTSILGTKTEDKLGTTKEGRNETFFGTNEKNGCAVSHRQNGEKYIPVSISIPSGNNKNNNNNLISQGMEDSSFVLELARRINDEEKVTQHNQFSDKDEDSRFVLQLDRRFKDGDQVTTNQFDRFSAAAAGKRKIDDGEYILVKSPRDFVADKKGNDRHMVGFRTMDGKGIVKFGENSMAQSFAGTTTQGEEGNPKENDDKSRKKHKSKDGEKKSRHKKEKDVEKDKKKAKTKKQDKNTTVPLTQQGKRNGPDDVSINAGMAYSVDSKVKGSAPFLSDGQRLDETEKRMKASDTNGPLISCSGGFEVMGYVPLYDQRNNATIEGSENRRKEMDTNEPVSSSKASSSTSSGKKNHASVRKNEKKKQKEIGTNGPEILTGAKNYSVEVTEVMGSVPLSSDSRNHVIVVGNAKKRNDISIDSLLHEKEARTNNKIPRLSPHNSLENGRKLEAHQSLKVLNSERHDSGTAKSLLQVDNNKEHQHQHQHQKNGLIDAKSLHILGPNPSVVLSDQIIERPRKSIPPHPDTEFLSQILTVPKMDEWNGLDDQEWLLRSQDPPPSREPTNTMSLAGVNDDLQVWSEALNIESMDIVAFPYVLPY